MTADRKWLRAAASICGFVHTLCLPPPLYLSPDPAARRYLYSLYWSIMTMTTGKALCYRCDDTTDSAQSRRAFDMGD